MTKSPRSDPDTDSAARETRVRPKYGDVTESFSVQSECDALLVCTTHMYSILLGCVQVAGIYGILGRLQ